MGGKPAKPLSPEQIISTIFSSSTRTIIESIQTAQSSVDVSQEINLYCSEKALDYTQEQVNRCIEELSDRDRNIEDIEELCKPMINCQATNISISSSINLSDINEQISNIKSILSNTLSSNIEQDISSLSPQLFISESDSSLITEYSETIIDNINSTIQDIITTFSASQSLNLSNYNADNVSISSVSNIITDNVQNISNLNNIVNRVSNNIIQSINSSNSITDTVQGLLYSVIGIFLLILIVLTILKRNNTKDFISMISIYIYFIIGVVIIYYSHVILKPSYILIPNMRYKIIDQTKLIKWVFIYSFVLGSGLFVYKRNN